MILVTGATGTNGVEIVKLLSRSGVRCRALVRNPEKISTLSDLPGVEVVQGDLSHPESLPPALDGVDRALLCSSIAPDLAELQGNFVRAAKKAGVRHIVKFSGNGCGPSLRMAVLAVAWNRRTRSGRVGSRIHALA